MLLVFLAQGDPEFLYTASYIRHKTTLKALTCFVDSTPSLYASQTRGVCPRQALRRNVLLPQEKPSFAPLQGTLLAEGFDT
jgi:hypothetical protein